MISTAPLSFDRATEQVEGMIHRGDAFARVEDAIDAARLSQHHKAALWLLAWSLRDPAVQRRDARLMAQAFAAPSLSTSGETLTIEESMNLEGENGERRMLETSRMELGGG